MRTAGQLPAAWRVALSGAAGLRELAGAQRGERHGEAWLEARIEAMRGRDDADHFELE